MADYTFDNTLNAIVFSVYGFICLIGILLLFFPGIYVKINDKLNRTIISTFRLPPLDTKIYYPDKWLFKHHVTIGLLLIILSLIAMHLFVILVNVL